jgi:NAD(P)-dependent dehydrogenase (short-subunit alcohol dehydrogenase family)
MFLPGLARPFRFCRVRIALLIKETNKHMADGKKTVLVTGASGNLGGAVIARLAGSGYRVLAIAGRKPASESGISGDVEWLSADLRDEREAGDLAQTAIGSAERLSAAVLLAGGFAMGSVGATGEKELEAMYRLNFLTAYNIARPLHRYFSEMPGGGQFILVGARPGLHPPEGRSMAAYSLSKALVIALADLLNDPSGTSVLATAIVPGIIDTPANREAMPGADRRTWVSPETIADIIAFRLSDAGKALRDTVIQL